MHGQAPFPTNMTFDENISGTLLDFGAAAKSDSRVPDDAGFDSEATEGAGDRRCAYIAADRWPVGEPPFCGAPVQPGSSYCPHHARLCVVDPASAEGVLLALGQELAAAAEAPPQLAHLAPVAVPELVEDGASLDRRELPIEVNDHQQPEDE